ncbi:hypothetical protein IV102_35320 [bacterium]|nr:hypothetical protein [bacterium]
MMARSEQEDDDEDKDDEIVRRERFPNPNPILTAGLAPGFTLQESEVFRHFYRKKQRPRDAIRETWVKGAPAGVKNATFIRITLYPLKNQSQALKTGQAPTPQDIHEAEPRLIFRSAHRGLLLGLRCAF